MNPHIHIVGTSHIARNSLNDIKEEFFKFKPDMIAVELDKRRLHALLSNQKPNYSPSLIRVIGVKGYLFAVIGAYIQQKLGKAVGITPGVDMKQGVILARNNQLQLILMDKDIMITLNTLSKQLGAKEKWRLAGDILFGWMRKNEQVRIRLDEVPSDKLIKTLLEKLKERYPTLHKVLVDDRNKHMARSIAHIHHKFPEKKILVIMGAGHKDGFEEYLKSYLKEEKKEKKRTTSASQTSTQS